VELACVRACVRACVHAHILCHASTAAHPVEQAPNPPEQVARCTKIINPNTDEAKYVINVKQIAKFVVGLGDKVAPTDIEEGMRVGVDRTKYQVGTSMLGTQRACGAHCGMPVEPRGKPQCELPLQAQCLFGKKSPWVEAACACLCCEPALLVPAFYAPPHLWRSLPMPRSKSRCHRASTRL